MTKRWCGKYIKTLCTFLSWFCLTVDLPRGGGPGHARALGNVNIANAPVHVHATAKGNLLGLIQVKEEPESERRSGRRKDFLPYDQRL